VRVGLLPAFAHPYLAQHVVPRTYFEVRQLLEVRHGVLSGAILQDIAGGLPSSPTHSTE
jgi:hypothetical protein